MTASHGHKISLPYVQICSTLCGYFYHPGLYRLASCETAVHCCQDSIQSVVHFELSFNYDGEILNNCVYSADLYSASNFEPIVFDESRDRIILTNEMMTARCSSYEMTI